MRVAFVSANRERLPDPVLPLGLLRVEAATPQRHARVFVDLCFEEDPHAVLTRALADFRPDVVAMGLRNVQDATYSDAERNILAYTDLAATLRSATSAPLVLGGAGFSVLPADILQRTGADLGVAGEGEGAFPALLDALETGTDPSAVPGVWRRIGDRVQAPTVPSPFLDLGALPPVDLSHVDLRYLAEGAAWPVQTHRGCPLRCRYCTYPLIEGRTVRRFPVDAAADEMLRVREFFPNVAHFFVVDSVFNLPTDHARAVCRSLRDRRVGVPWTCYANPIGFSAGLAEDMAAAGCVGVEVGADSGLDHVLTALDKGFSAADIRTLHDHCVRVGIKDCQTFLLATPGETLDDVRRTLDFITDLQPFCAILMLWRDDRVSVDPVLRAARESFEEAASVLIRERAAAEPRWTVPSLGIRFGTRLFRALRRRGRTGPLWQTIDRGDAR